MAGMLCKRCRNENANNESIAIKIKNPTKLDDQQNSIAMNTNRGSSTMKQRNSRVGASKKLKSFYHEEIEQI